MKTKKINIISFITVFLILGITGNTTAGESSRGGTFLPLGWDARGEGLAGAASLLARDDGAAYWNPANLVFLGSAQMTLGTTRPVSGMDNLYSIFSIGTGLLDSRVSPDSLVSMRRFGAAITITHLGLRLASGSEWNEGTIGFSGAFSPNHFNSIGMSWKMLKSWTQIDNADSWGMAFDIGWTARLHKNVWFALVGKNLNGTVHYPESDDNLDSSFNFAISWENILDRVSIEFDAVRKEGELNRILGGSEIIIVDGLLHLLAGVDRRLVNGKRTITHFGICSCYRNAKIALSFSFDPLDTFGKQTRLSIGYRL